MRSLGEISASSLSRSDGSPWGVLFFTLLVIGGVVCVVIWQGRVAKRRHEADRSAGVIARLDLPGATPLRLTQNELIEGDEPGRHHPLAGMVGRVEEGGTVNRRLTVTRIVALGPLAAGLPKVIDDREVYITVEGPSTVIVQSVHSKKGRNLALSARKFVATLNNASRVVDPSSDVELGEKLAYLSRLHGEGALTRAEYEAKRSQLLSDY